MKKNTIHFTDFTSVVNYLISANLISEEQATEIEKWVEPLDVNGFDEKECMDILSRWQIVNEKYFPWDTKEEAKSFGIANSYYGKEVTLSAEEMELFNKWWTARERAAEERTHIHNGRALEVFHRAKTVYCLIQLKAPAVVLKEQKNHYLNPFSDDICYDRNEQERNNGIFLSCSIPSLKFTLDLIKYNCRFIYCENQDLQKKTFWRSSYIKIKKKKPLSRFHVSLLTSPYLGIGSVKREEYSQNPIYIFDLTNFSLWFTIKNSSCICSVFY